MCKKTVPVVSTCTINSKGRSKGKIQLFTGIQLSSPPNYLDQVNLTTVYFNKENMWSGLADEPT